MSDISRQNSVECLCYWKKLSRSFKISHPIAGVIYRILLLLLLLLFGNIFKILNLMQSRYYNFAR
jgi:hypothetical protein